MAEARFCYNVTFSIVLTSHTTTSCAHLREHSPITEVTVWSRVTFHTEAGTLALAASRPQLTARVAAALKARKWVFKLVGTSLITHISCQAFQALAHVI